MLKEEDFKDEIMDLEESIENLILKKAKLSTCKILLEKMGTGFFCRIPIENNNIMVLLTNNKIINENYLQLGKMIKLSYKNELKKITINEKRFYCINNILNYTCIQILESDLIEDFYEIENYNINIFNELNNEYLNDEISIPQYPKGKLIVKGGYIKNINNNIIKHTCIIGNNSIGSPILLNLRNFKVIGIFNEYLKEKKINEGTFITPISEDISKIFKLKETLYNKAKKSTCKVMLPGICSTAFFCQIPFRNSNIKVLFTCNHVINENSLIIGKTIKLFYKEKEKEIEITKERFCHSNQSLDYTCIQILESDLIEDFYEIEEQYYENPSEEYLKDEIILPIYPQAGELKISIGQLNYFRNEKIFYTIDSGFGAAGGPIILKNRNYKVIGIHKAMRKKDGKKMGLSIKYIMDDINKVTGFNG